MNTIIHINADGTLEVLAAHGLARWGGNSIQGCDADPDECDTDDD